MANPRPLFRPFATSLLTAALFLSACTPLSSSTPFTIGNTTPPLPHIPERKFIVTDFGTVANGVADDSAAITSALDALEKAGGGILHFPPGTYMSGPLLLRSNTNLHLDKNAILRFNNDPARYPTRASRWEGTECMNYSPLMYGENLHDIIISGEGTIDGQGQTWWAWKDRSEKGGSMKSLRELGETQPDPAKRVFGYPDSILRPCLLEPRHSQRILLMGVTFTNSPFWTLHPTYCENITVRGITVIGDGPNTDGFDPDSCRNILVENCIFDTGDDCITLKSGRDKDGRRVGIPLENVVVRNCRFLRGHGTVVIGSEMSGGVRNVWADSLIADGTDAGVRIKTRRGRGGIVENIHYNNMTLKNILKQAITIDMFYDVGNNPEVPQTDPAGIPIFRNITVDNLTCDNATTALFVQGLPESPITGLEIRNVTITKAGESTTFTNAPKAIIDNLVIKNATTQPAAKLATQPATQPATKPAIPPAS